MYARVNQRGEGDRPLVIQQAEAGQIKAQQDQWQEDWEWLVQALQEKC